MKNRDTKNQIKNVNAQEVNRKTLTKSPMRRVGIDFLKISLAESWANFFRKSLARGMSVVQACETTTKW